MEKRTCFILRSDYFGFAFILIMPNPPQAETHSFDKQSARMEAISKDVLVLVLLTHLLIS